MKDLLITGGAGFVGTNLTSYILEETDWFITILDDLSVGKFEYIQGLNNFDPERVEFIEGDVRDGEVVKETIKDCDYIVHLAAQTDVMRSIDEPREDADINIMGTINILNGAVEEDIEGLVFASSAAPLGEQEQPVNEGKVPQPLSPYGASKLSGEGYCSAFSGSYDLRTTALRFSNVYGPNSWHKGSVVAKFIKQILDGETPVIYGDGGQTRDFIHTEDISQAIYLSLTRDLDGYELFQVGTGDETSVNELYDLIKGAFDKENTKVPEPIYGEARQGEIYRNYADIRKAEELLGFSPDVDLKEGITETVRWFLENY